LVCPTAAIASLGPDQALVLKLLQRWVDRARARPPDSAATLADLLNDLVAIHRLLREQSQRSCSDVPATGARPAHAARPTPMPEPRVATGEAWPWREARHWREARTAEWAGEVPPAAMGAPAPGMPLVVVIVPAAALAIFGRLPPARTAAPAAFLLVSHLFLLVSVSSQVFTAGLS